MECRKSRDANMRATRYASRSKSHKRIVKHTALIQRLQQSTPTYRRVNPSLKRRRPSKKMVTDLASLEAALPITNDPIEPTALAMSSCGVKGSKIRYTSLKTKPGARKRRERLLEAERHKFSKNLAVMASSDLRASDAESHTTTNMARENNLRARWSAIRDVWTQKAKG